MINVDTTSDFEKTNQNCGSSVVGIYLALSFGSISKDS